MGTRADFYIGRGENAEWLGSIALDGYPSGITPHSTETVARYGYERHVDAEWPAGESLFDATDEATFRSRLARFFEYRDDVTLPEMGWPWPWENSQTTDYSYAFDGGRVWASCFGHEWFDPLLPESDGDDEEEESSAKVPFPNMATDRVAMPGSKRSGMFVVTAEPRP
jgi:hypothetical protein